MTEQMLNQSQGVAAGWTRKLNIRLAGAAVGLALALLIVPGSRRLFLAQTVLCLPMPGNVASLAGSQLGVKPDPFEGQIAVREAVAVAERNPDDVQIQIARAALYLPSDGNNSSLQKVRRLRALEGRFGNSPSLYANILRYEASGEIRVRHHLEQYTAGGEPVTPEVLETARRFKAEGFSQPVYAAFDRDAEAGERLDPDNAYFPFMRAVGLFGAQRDGEAVAAMERASRKPHWREYYNDELKGQWKLQDASSVNNSALFHSVSAMGLLFPQYAQMRAAVRVIIHKAITAEQAGNVREGLELRECALRLGSLMRADSANIIAALVGNAIVDTAIARPGGEPAIKSTERNASNSRDSKETTRTRRLSFDAYLRRVNATSRMAMFHAAQQTGDEINNIVREDSTPRPFDQPFTNLIGWWMADLVTLSNILWLLVLGTLAALCLRARGTREGHALPRYARLALPLGVMAGAFFMPSVMSSGMSPYVNQITEGMKTAFFLTGLAAILPFLLWPASTGKERLCRLGAYACGLPVGAMLAVFYVWQGRGIVAISELLQIAFNLSDAPGASSSNLITGMLWFTPCVSLLILTGSAIISHASQVPLSVGIARGLRGLMVPVVAALLLVYGGMLLCTIRAEATVEYGLKRTLENEGQYLADLSNKQWPRADVAKKLVNNE